MAQSGFTPIQLYFSTTASATPSAGNLANGELAINITDGRLFYKDNGGTVQVLATKAGANGDVVGPASATDNALVRFDNISGKLVQNSVGILDDSGNLSGIAALTTSGALTLNGGTANGVAYLNGSKVLTTGSALTFDGTNFNVVRAAATDQYMSLYADGTGPTFKFFGGAAGKIAGITADSAASQMLFTNEGNKPFVYAINGSEQMRLTSTGLGIGTSSPQAKLSVSSGGSENLEITPGNVATNGCVIQYLNRNTGTTRPDLNYYLSSGGGSHKFYTNDTERMRLDSSGNLGLGVTPSAWGLSGLSAMQIRNAGFYGYDATEVGVAGNAYYGSSAWRYIGTGASQRYTAVNGQHIWYTAPSGTAGNAISFTQVLTVAADGKATSTAVGVDNNFTLNSTAGAYSTTLTLAAAGGGGSTINATGASSDYLRFTITGTERARIDSSGNLLVGTTSNSSVHRLVARQDSSTAGQNAISAVNSSSASSGVGTYNSSLGTGNAGNTNCYHFRGITENVNIYYLYGNGTSSFTSDERMKKNIETARDGYLDDLMQLRVVKYNWKNDDDNAKKEMGLIAQEVEQVFPGLVQEADTAFDGVTPKVLKASVIPFMLLKAIQELKAELDATKARLATLEAAANA